MRTVTYKSVLDGALRMVGLDPTQAQSVDKFTMMEFLDQALSGCHEYWRWPELVKIEKRFFRTDYASGTTYAAGEERYFPASQSYYRALKATTGNAPATLAAGTWSTNTAYWWECSSEVSGNDWADATAYAVGDQVRNTSDGLYYACHTAHTSSGSFNATKFGAIAAFRPNIEYAQTGQTQIEAVIEVYDADPRTDAGALKVAFKRDYDGVQFAADELGPVWLEFRVKCPDFTWSAIWSATTFSANTQVYYPTTGEVYRASSSAAGTDIPGTAALWVKQDVPYQFRHVAKYRTVALWLENEGKSDRALIFDNDDPATPGKFQNELEEQVWQYTKLQGQTGRVNTLVPAN